jgi:hypothetical protein
MGSNLWKIFGGICVLIGAIAGVIVIVAHFQNTIDRFEGDISQQATADGFVSFALGHDTKTVWVNVVCHYYQPGHPCETGDASSPLVSQGEAENDTVIAVHATAGDYWIHINTASTDAAADNGSFGAGTIVIKGYFSVNDRGGLGSTPSNVYNILLKGVDSSTIKSS